MNLFRRLWFQQGAKKKREKKMFEARSKTAAGMFYNLIYKFENWIWEGEQCSMNRKLDSATFDPQSILTRTKHNLITCRIIAAKKRTSASIDTSQLPSINISCQDGISRSFISFKSCLQVLNKIANHLIESSVGPPNWIMSRFIK